MGLIKGGFLRLLQTILYALAFCCSAIILGVYSYFLAVLADRDLPISRDWKAVEGLSGAAVLYTILAFVLTCFLGGVTLFAFVGSVLNVCFVGAMIAVTILTRSGANSCSGHVTTPLGSGDANSNAVGANHFGFGSHDNLTYSPDLGLACKLNTAAFSVSIIGAFIFLLTALMQIVLARTHKKESRYGPSPANNYTSGYGGSPRKFWQRKPKATASRDMTPAYGTTPAYGESPRKFWQRKPKNMAPRDMTPAYGTAPAYGETPRKFWQRKPKNMAEKDAEFGMIGTGAALGDNSGVYKDFRSSHDTAPIVANAGYPRNETGVIHGDHARHAAGYDTHAARSEYYSASHTAANPYGYDNTTGIAKEF